MITVKRLKELIKDLPDDAKCYAYEGEDVGIAIFEGSDEDDASILDSEHYWWIRMRERGRDTHVEGFNKNV